MNFLLYYLRPFKSLEYLSKYFSACRLIFQRNQKLLTQIRFIQYHILVKSIHYAFLYFTRSNNVQAFTVYDDTYMYNAQKEIMQLVYFLMCFLTIYFYEKMYINPNLFLVDFLEEIIFKKRSKLFVVKSPKLFESIQSLAKAIIVFTQTYIITIGKVKTF